jgi:hypothetical protein
LVVRFTTAGFAASAISDQAGVVALGGGVEVARSVQSFPDTFESPELGRTSSTAARTAGAAHRPDRLI